eukprot:1998275-Prymnesium_polylepis.1
MCVGGGGCVAALCVVLRGGRAPRGGYVEGTLPPKSGTRKKGGLWLSPDQYDQSPPLFRLLGGFTWV